MTNLADVKNSVDALSSTISTMARDNRDDHKGIFGMIDDHSKRIQVVERRHSHEDGVKNGKSEKPHPHRRDADTKQSWHQRIVHMDRTMMLLLLLAVAVGGEKFLGWVHHLLNMWKGLPVQ